MSGDETETMLSRTLKRPRNLKLAPNSLRHFVVRFGSSYKTDHACQVELKVAGEGMHPHILEVSVQKAGILGTINMAEGRSQIVVQDSRCPE
jgi:hypothetical protein